MPGVATLGQLIETILPNFITPVPSRDTLRHWFDSAKIPRFKSSPTAKRGGGSCYYSVAAVEKLLRSKMVSGNPSHGHKRLLGGPLKTAPISIVRHRAEIPLNG
jgi:hypothetical protein